MTTKKHLLSLLIMALLSPGLFSYTLLPTNSARMSVQIKTSPEGAHTYKSNYEKFEYYIGSIGYVTIDNVELNNGTLTANYSYKSEGETRQVTSVLHLDSDGIYKGTCTTKVNGKVQFAVNTWLSFEPDGTAAGNWCWTGIPTEKDPVVKISKTSP